MPSINMPKLINTTYYNLVNTILLDPTHIRVYIDYLIKSNFNTFDTEIINPKNLMALIELRMRLNNGILPHFVNDTGKTFNAHYFDCLTPYSLYDLVYYVEYLDYYNFINTKERRTLIRVIRGNTYGVRRLLINKIEKMYMDEHILAPISKKIAINKIKRNAIYNLGLGLKLAVRAYSKDF